MLPFMIQAAGVRDEAEALMLARAGVTHIGLPLRLDYHAPDVDDEGARHIVAAVADWNRRMAQWERRAGGQGTGVPGAKMDGAGPDGAEMCDAVSDGAEMCDAVSDGAVSDGAGLDGAVSDDQGRNDQALYDRKQGGGLAAAGAVCGASDDAAWVGQDDVGVGQDDAGGEGPDDVGVGQNDAGVGQSSGNSEFAEEREPGSLPKGVFQGGGVAAGATGVDADAANRSDNPLTEPFRPVQTILITYQEKALDVALLAQSLGVDGVQLHGAFTPDEAAELRRVLPELVVFKSLVVGRDDVRAEVAAYAPHVHAFLTDTYDPERGASGATGLTHDWAVSRELVRLSPVPVILAGGLTPENVAKAIRTVRPAGVDAHTGLEDENGAKDPEKVRRFVREALSAMG